MKKKPVWLYTKNFNCHLLLIVTATIGWKSKSMTQQISCDRSHNMYDICSTNGPTVFDPKASTLYVLDPAHKNMMVEKVRPYPRKAENNTMADIKEVALISGPASPSCMIHHNVPALVFSTGGVYTGNFFHEFNDGFIPLFITVHSVFPNQDFILVISAAQDWWLRKYADLLGSFSKHPIIHLENDTATHCFTSATVGLISHGFVTISPSLIPGFKNFTHFHAMLENAYGPNHHSFVPKPPQKPQRPRLVLASRSGGGRVILNQYEVARAAEEIGFEVIVFEPTAQTPLRESYGLIKSSHAMIGVHGAALTHQLFLRPGSVTMQIVPIGAESVSEYCYGNLARELNLQYVEYKIGAEESSLVEKYGKEDIVLKNPLALQAKGWSQKVMDIYLREQNVKLDLVRFRKYLNDAYGKAKIFFDTKG